MKNFIEVTLQEENALININHIVGVRGSQINFGDISDYLVCKESYEEIIEKIKEAQE